MTDDNRSGAAVDGASTWQAVGKLAAAAALAARLLFAEGAAAQLSEVDLVPGSGDAKITLDAATGLQWLDLPETTNLSVPDILGGAGGWVGNGWSYATAPEICELFAAYAVAVADCGSRQGGLTTGDVLSTFQGFLGVTSDGGPLALRVTSGFYEDRGDPALVGAASVTYSTSFDWSGSLVQDDAALPNATPNAGHRLVRLPEPSGELAQIVGIACVTMLARRARHRRSRQ